VYNILDSLTGGCSSIGREESQRALTEGRTSAADSCCRYYPTDWGFDT